MDNTLTRQDVVVVDLLQCYTKSQFAI